MRLSRLMLCVVAALGCFPAACNTDGLIGGDCDRGSAYCHGRCISIVDDEANCGACDVACRRNLACVEGLCGGPDGDITVDDLPGGNGGQGGAGPDDGSGGITVGAGGPGGRGGSGGTASAAGGTANAAGGGDGCLEPIDKPNSCGSCNVRCPASAPNCTPTEDGGHVCIPNCTVEPFITECSGKCVDVTSDPGHCGRCFNACASGICADGECIGAASGHEIAICASYEGSSSGQTTLLTNAVFLGSANPVRILAYVRDTSNASLTGTDQALESASQQAARSYNVTKVTALNAVNNQLSRSDYDVLLVYDQQAAPSGRLAELGTSWASTIHDFSRTGGVTVILSGGGGRGEMGDFITNLGLMQVQSSDDYTGERYYVSAPGDAIGINVVSPFLAIRTSCIFNTSDAASGELVFVVRGGTDADAAPGVVHRIIAP